METLRSIDQVISGTCKFQPRHTSLVYTFSSSPLSSASAHLSPFFSLPLSALFCLHLSLFPYARIFKIWKLISPEIYRLSFVTWAVAWKELQKLQKLYIQCKKWMFRQQMQVVILYVVHNLFKLYCQGVLGICHPLCENSMIVFICYVMDAID